jgi:O-antigen/teichoic acid export membrane protein
MVAQAISVLVVPVLARLYSPAAFGTAAVFAAILFVVSTIACLRYELAIMLPEQDEDAINVLALSLLVALLLMALCALVVLPAHQPIAHFLNAPDLAPYLWLLPPALFTSGAFQALTYWNSRTRHFNRLSVARVASVATSKGSQMALGAGGFASAGALIASDVAGSAVIAATLGGQVWRDTSRLFMHHTRLERILSMLQRYRKFPLVDSWGTLINRTSQQLPVFVLALFFSQAIVGYYILVYRLVQLPMTLIGTSLVQVFFERTSRIRENPHELASVAMQTFQGLVALSLGPTLIITITGNDVLALVLGREWVESGIYLQILAPWMFFLFISAPLSVVFMVVERQEQLLIFHVLIFVTRVAALAIGVLFDDIYLTLAIFSVTGALVYGGLAFWNMKLAGVSLRTTLRMLLQYTLYAAVVALPLLPIVLVWQPGEVWVVVVSAAALAGYYLVLLWWDAPLRQRLLALFRARLPART